jgi:cellulose biosynthesis protein BcsQ
MNKPAVLSLLSGKGGVGKTVIACSIAEVISKLDKKVLLIDCDLATSGLSYFYIDEIEENTSKTLYGICSTYNNDTKISSANSKIREISDPNKAFYRIKDNFYFLPSISSLSNENTLDEGFNHRDDILPESISKTLYDLIKKNPYGFDYIIFDLQAGYTNLTSFFVDYSTIGVIILEADPISMWAVKNLERKLFSSGIKNVKIFYLINKLFTEEASQYKLISNYLVSIQHLPPIEFDFSVRQAFAQRKVPIDFSKPSRFDVSLIRIIPFLFPELRTSTDSLIENIKSALLEPLMIHKDIVSNKLSELILKKNRDKSFENTMSLMGLILLFGLGIYLGITGKLEQNSLAILISTGIVLLAIISSAGIGTLRRLYRKYIQSSTSDDKDMQMYEHQLFNEKVEIESEIRRRLKILE